ncbi:Extracellular elastase [Seminavis robusta]|uniref:Extracellular elastase n=1 Tax=Seminavis robusta TaxID=568900 RepID=A0A9N8HJY4_9STRA|nr:Extracellular elastase [Seminavis robusta]|eukprot:Sro581_g170240.1 Extracellular elastase (607) ;mRNA; r:19377-21731
MPDMSRHVSLSDEDVPTLESRGLFAGGQTNSFSARQVNQVKSNDGSTCLVERHRVRELVQGLPVYGADFVVTTSECSQLSAIERSALVNTNTLATMNTRSIVSVDGYRLNAVRVPTGFTPKHATKEEGVSMVAGLFGVPEYRVTTLALEIFPTENQDYRAWIGTVWDESIPGEPQLYQVVVDDETDEIILKCDIAGAVEKQEKLQRKAEIRHRYLQGAGSQLDASKCDSCATIEPGIAWNPDQTVECDVETLYLNNDGRKTLCITGTDGSGNQRVAPGPIFQYHWHGTLNCNSGKSCSVSEVPNCADALSDVQWGAVNYFQYLQEHLGLMGGLTKEAENPIPVVGRVHYEEDYCNAFYVPGDRTVTFGDCDCDIFYPLVSTDVVVHELTHGLTSESSNLLYLLQSGGLNEAYSDLMGCALEFTINDSKDTPDFLVGESLAGPGLGREFLRSMENPSADGKSISTFCEYRNSMNVHYTSGFLNRAYVNAVRACENTCGSSLKECVVLLANTFLYANLEMLSMNSGFRDAAKQTCNVVDEFFAARAPTTSCTVQQAREAISVGFAAVGVGVNTDTCYAQVVCTQTNACAEAFEVVRKVARSIASFFTT